MRYCGERPGCHARSLDLRSPRSPPADPGLEVAICKQDMAIRRPSSVVCPAPVSPGYHVDPLRRLGTVFAGYSGSLLTALPMPLSGGPPPTNSSMEAIFLHPFGRLSASLLLFITRSGASSLVGTNEAANTIGSSLSSSFDPRPWPAMEAKRSPSCPRRAREGLLGLCLATANEVARW